MTNRELIRHATQILTETELRVWLAKHINGNGRRSGSLALGITEDQYRYHLNRAETKMAAARKDDA